MANPWLEWWENFTNWWSLWQTPPILKQFAGLGIVLLLALVLDRILERRRVRRFGDAPAEQRKIRSLLWVTKFPILVLILGGVAVAFYSAADWPIRTLKHLVGLFWYVLVFSLVGGAMRLFLPPGDAHSLRRKTLLPLLTLVTGLHLTGILDALWKWVSQPILNLASGTITMASVWLALAVVAGFWLFSLGGKTLFLRAFLPRTKADPALANSVASFAQIAVVTLGLWIALDTLGVQFSNLTLLITALTVGIGFGLQDLIKNVTGGMILLGEGHVRPGKVFKIGEETGRVETIGIRSTKVRTLDGSQVIVPNADLIANKVIDLTESRRVEVTVGVSYDSEPQLVEQLLLEFAATHPSIVDDPAPVVLFQNLGESSLDFVLYCYVADRAQLLRTKSDLLFVLIESFRRHGVEIPNRQVDVHVRTLSQEQAIPPGTS